MIIFPNQWFYQKKVLIWLGVDTLGYNISKDQLSRSKTVASSLKKVHFWNPIWRTPSALWNNSCINSSINNYVPGHLCQRCVHIRAWGEVAREPLWCLPSRWRQRKLSSHSGSLSEGLPGSSESWIRRKPLFWVRCGHSFHKTILYFFVCSELQVGFVQGVRGSRGKLVPCHPKQIPCLAKFPLWNPLPSK